MKQLQLKDFDEKEDGEGYSAGITRNLFAELDTHNFSAVIRRNIFVLQG